MKACAWTIAALLAFAAPAAAQTLFQGRIDEVNHQFQPKSVKEEVKEELDDFASRSGGLSPLAAGTDLSPPPRGPA